MLIRWFSTFVISGDPRYDSHPRSRFGFVTQSSSPGVLGDEIKLTVAGETSVLAVDFTFKS